MNAEAQSVREEKTDRGIPTFSIGIYSGPTLSNLKPAEEMKNPVLSAVDVTDAPAQFVADPFMIRVGGIWSMFFEVMNSETDRGEIGLATSGNGLEWRYEHVVLRESFHLSYPYVFRIGSQFFIIPESYQAEEIRLYRADSFPFKWSYVTTLFKGPWVDSSPFFFEGRWWMFSSPVAPPNQVLELLYADAIGGPWQRHPMSPLITGNNGLARGGGRVILVNNKPIRFTQDCFPVYGTRVRAFDITFLTTSSYAEQEMEGSPVLRPGQQLWNQSGMHHIDAHLTDNGWLACVDGWRPDINVKNKE